VRILPQRITEKSRNMPEKEKSCQGWERKSRANIIPIISNKIKAIANKFFQAAFLANIDFFLLSYPVQIP
jgi:hypothetical protein